MRMDKKPATKLAVLVLGIIAVLAVGYFVYQLYIVPETIRLPVPGKFPSFGVWYSYSITSESPTTFLLGSEKVSSLELSAKIEEDMLKIKEIGFESVKLSFHFGQNNYFPERIALKVAKNGMIPVGILLGHQAKPKDRAFTEQEMTDWESFVRDEVGKNKNMIYYWEVWNEPGLDMFRYGNPDEYLELLKRSYKVIKEENSDAKVIVTLDNFDRGPKDFSNSLLERGGGDYFDILSFHPYGANPYIREDVFNQSVSKIKELETKYANRWPLIISEIGQPDSEVGVERQAQLGGFVLGRAKEENIPVIWLHYSDARLNRIDNSEGWGIFDTSGNPKPLYYVMRSEITGEAATVSS